MSGKIVIADGRGHEVDGGDYWERGRAPGDYRFSRFSLTFADGGSLLLIDPRRLGRVRLTRRSRRSARTRARSRRRSFAPMIARGGAAPVKARLLDQDSIAGVGNLLADQALWLAKINPARPVRDLSRADVDRLLRALRRAIEAAVAGGGVHTLSVLPFRKADATCPRCGVADEARRRSAAARPGGASASRRSRPAFSVTDRLLPSGSRNHATRAPLGEVQIARSS